MEFKPAKISNRKVEFHIPRNISPPGKIPVIHAVNLNFDKGLLKHSRNLWLDYTRQIVKNQSNGSRTVDNDLDGISYRFFKLFYKTIKSLYLFVKFQIVLCLHIDNRCLRILLFDNLPSNDTSK